MIENVFVEFAAQRLFGQEKILLGLVQKKYGTLNRILGHRLTIPVGHVPSTALWFERNVFRAARRLVKSLNFFFHIFKKIKKSYLNFFRSFTFFAHRFGLLSSAWLRDTLCYNVGWIPWGPRQPRPVWHVLWWALLTSLVSKVNVLKQSSKNDTFLEIDSNHFGGIVRARVSAEYVQSSRMMRCGCRRAVRIAFWFATSTT